MPNLIQQLKQTGDEAKMAVILKSFVKKIYAPPLIRLKQFGGMENKEGLTRVLAAMYQED